jgi:hypothetical protein
MVEAIREGKVPDVIRRKGAEGGLPVSLGEKIEILTLLSKDKDTEIRKKALDTLYNWDRQELQEILADPVTPPDVLDFATNYLAPSREDLLEALISNPNLPDDLREEIESNLLRAAQQAATRPQQPPVPPALAEPAAAEIQDQEPAERETLIQKINRMSAIEKVKAAIIGNQETRSILIRDSNKLVARAVLQSPKLSDAEIEGYAAAKNVSEGVLRLISINRAFMKSYSVVRALINNPRAPIDITLPLVNRLNERDLKMLTTNRNVADVIRATALKMMKQREEASKPKMPGKH